MRTSIHILSSALLTMSALGLAATPAQGAGGSQMSTPCAVVETVWAAGSGQDLGAGDQARWVSELDRLIMTSKVSVHHYELGQDKGSGGYGGHSYDPVDVDNIWNGNPLGAWAGSGYAFDYGKSVDTGVGELYNYLIQRTDKCGTAQFVLGGYSQGAQVVGQTMEKLNSERPCFRPILETPNCTCRKERGSGPLPAEAARTILRGVDWFPTAGPTKDLWARGSLTSPTLPSPRQVCGATTMTSSAELPQLSPRPRLMASTRSRAAPSRRLL